MSYITSLEELEHHPHPLTVKEAAIICGESPSNFYKMVRRGEVPGVFRCKKTPKARIKICPRELAAWIREEIAAGRRVKIAIKPQSNGNGKSSIEGHEQERSGSDATNRGKEKREEGHVG